MSLVESPLGRCLPNGLYKASKKPDKIATIAGLKADELGQAAKVMMYIRADEDDVCDVAFEEWHCRIAPVGGHTVASIVELQRCIEEYGCSPLPRAPTSWAATPCHTQADRAGTMLFLESIFID